MKASLISITRISKSYLAHKTTIFPASLHCGRRHHQVGRCIDGIVESFQFFPIGSPIAQALTLDRPRPEAIPSTLVLTMTLSQKMKIIEF